MEAKDSARPRGRFHIECRDKHGNLKWVEDCDNIITNEGLDAWLDVHLHGATQITTWYCALVESDTAAAAGLTYATPTYTECEAYNEATRPEYEEAAASSQSITNSANPATFTISDTKTLYGASIVGGGTDGNTKGDAAGGGTLHCYSQFATERGAIAGDVLNLTYAVSLADS